MALRNSIRHVQSGGHQRGRVGTRNESGQTARQIDHLGWGEASKVNLCKDPFGNEAHDVI